MKEINLAFFMCKYISSKLKEKSDNDGRQTKGPNRSEGRTDKEETKKWKIKIYHFLIFVYPQVICLSCLRLKFCTIHNMTIKPVNSSWKEVEIQEETARVGPIGPVPCAE